MSGLPSSVGTKPISGALPAADSGASAVPHVPCTAKGTGVKVVLILIAVRAVVAVPVVTNIGGITMCGVSRSRKAAPAG